MFAFDDRTRALLTAIRRAGSIAAAARALGMDASNARRHLATAAERAGAPLVAARRGGADRGRASLTPNGVRLLGVSHGRLVGVAQAYDARAGVTPVRCGGRTLYAAGRIPEGPVELRIPPEHVVLARAAPDSSARNALPAQVMTVTASEEGIYVIELQAGALRLASRVTRAARRELRLRPGSRVVAMLKATSLDIIPH